MADTFQGIIFFIIIRSFLTYVCRYPESRPLRYNHLRNRDELAEFFTGVIAQSFGAVTVAQALACY